MNAAVMYRRRVIETVGGFDTSLVSCEDYDLYLRIARHYPVHSYSRIVAEYRRHDDSMSMDPARMLQGLLTMFKTQWPHVRGNLEHIRAYRAGLRHNVKVAYWPLLGSIRRSLRAGQLGRALRLSLRLFRHPTLLPRAVWLECRLRTRLALTPSSAPP